MCRLHNTKKKTNKQTKQYRFQNTCTNAFQSKRTSEASLHANVYRYRKLCYQERKSKWKIKWRGLS